MLSNHCSSPSKINAAIEMYRRIQPKYLMLDSSGYQLRLWQNWTVKDCRFNPNCRLNRTSREFNIAPKHVMESALVFQPYLPDIVIGLDFPIRKLKQGEVDWIKNFLKSLYTMFPGLSNRQPGGKSCAPKLIYFCQSNATIWINLISSGAEWAGLSMMVFPFHQKFGIPEIALFFVKFYQLGIKRVHLLGTSKFFSIALCAYMARHVFEWVSIDASSWRKAADKAECFNPYDLSREKLGFQGDH